MPDENELGFVHRWVAGERPEAPVLLLLHGTGGTEDDLLPLGALLLPGAAMLSPRGQVLENGAPRFFRRLSAGVFDVPDLKRRADELAAFVERAGAAYGFGARQVIAVGYSNGANIASAMLLANPGAARAAVLFRPMTPYRPDPLPSLAGTGFLLSAGRRDPMSPPDEVERLATLLRSAGAAVDVEYQPSGHELTEGAVAGARAWIARLA